MKRNLFNHESEANQKAADAAMALDDDDLSDVAGGFPYIILLGKSDAAGQTDGNSPLSK